MEYVTCQSFMHLIVQPELHFRTMPREFDARLIHMHGHVMMRFRRPAAVLLLWRAAAATRDDSVLLYIPTSPNHEQHTDTST